MISRLGDFLRFLVCAFNRERSPRQLALGIALGVVIGLVPKANLVAVALVLMLFALRINLLAGLTTAIGFSWLSLLIDPVLDHLGRALLTLVPLQPLFAGIYELPYVPWTAFNNTVVMGALFVGLLQFYPTYRFAKRYFDRRLGTYQDWRVRPTASTSTPEYHSSAWRLG